MKYILMKLMNLTPRKTRAGNTTHDNQLCDILAPSFDTDPCLEVSSNVPAFSNNFQV